MDHCQECGFTYDLGRVDVVAAAIVTGVDRFAALLREHSEQMRIRTEATLWSPLEYGCHLRDVLLVQRERLLAARRLDKPVLEPMGRDERVEYDGYAEQDPDEVAGQLVMAAQLFVHDLARLGPADWERVVTYPEKSERTLGWLAVHTWHEVDHHLLDVDRQLA